jgi:hypothetical protein
MPMATPTTSLVVPDLLCATKANRWFSTTNDEDGRSAQACPPGLMVGFRADPHYTFGAMLLGSSPGRGERGPHLAFGGAGRVRTSDPGTLSDTLVPFRVRSWRKRRPARWSERGLSRITCPIRPKAWTVRRIDPAGPDEGTVNRHAGQHPRLPGSTPDGGQRPTRRR